MKATHAGQAHALEDIPNVGPRIARDLRLLGFSQPRQLKGKDPFALYTKLSAKKKFREDPCVLDVLMSVVAFMDGAPPAPWWHYTPERKRAYPDI